MTIEEGYLNEEKGDFPGNLKSDLFRLDRMQMITKLRPSVRSFLKEASNLFEMSIYTMGERQYALQMAKLLDPEDKYFNSRIIAKGDSTQTHQKGLDVFMGHERAVIILDDTESVWRNNKDNLILMERYHFFASSCKEFGLNCKSLSELGSDESEIEGALMTVLKILKEIHCLFFEEGNLEDQDVRQVLKSVRKKILKDCKIVFTRVAPTNSIVGHHPLWRMAEEMGAVCSTEVDASVTHVVSRDTRTSKSRWAVQEKKHLVDPMWIEACNYLWRKQSEKSFPVRQ